MLPGRPQQVQEPGREEQHSTGLDQLTDPEGQQPEGVQPDDHLQVDLGFNNELTNGEGLGLVNNLVNSVFVSFAHVNLNCLTNKVVFVRDLIITNHIDILGISETWLTPEICDPTSTVAGYLIVRNDSPSGLRKHGVAFYIRDTMKFEIITAICS